MNRLLRFWSWPRREKRLFFIVIAYFFHTFFLAYIQSSRKLKHHLGDPDSDVSYSLDEQAYIFAKQLATAIGRVKRLLRLKNSCLAYALVAKKILEKNHIPHTLYLGIYKKNGRWLAHAWLACCSVEIVGYEEKASFKIIGKFVTAGFH